MPRVTFLTGGGAKSLDCRAGVSLLEAAAEAGVAMSAPCGGKGICGNCRVKAVGAISVPDGAERDFLGELCESGTRLACMTFVTGDCFVEVGTGSAGKENTLQAKSERILPASGSKKCVAAAVDIGTTTVGIGFYSLPDGRFLGSRAFMNPQSVFGADVVTRLEYCIKSGQAELTEAINGAIAQSCADFGAEPEFYVFTGNTVMLHIAAGRDARGLANFPFEPETLFGEWDGNRYYMPCASAYIGADVIASGLAAGIGRGAAAVLSDIGTNSETLLYTGDRVLACSSAAGPAFEGAHISRGMPALEGAITGAVISGGKVSGVDVIGGGKPKGFCGSGLLSAVDALYANGYLAPSGDLLASLPDFCGIRLTPGDIAQFQIAKSAVHAGISALLHRAGAPEIRAFYPAGSFGTHIDLSSAARVGMIPKYFADIAKKPVSAADGAAMVLLDASNAGKALSLAKRTETVELANDEFFADAFISGMYFPVPEDE